jgi:hypothetical protein
VTNDERRTTKDKGFRSGSVCHSIGLGFPATDAPISSVVRIVAGRAKEDISLRSSIFALRAKIDEHKNEKYHAAAG